MKVFVIAMDNEAECVISNLEGAEEKVLFGRRTISGRLNGEDALVVVAGIGKGNAAAAAQMAIQLTGTMEIFNIGVAGGLQPSMKVGDLYEVSAAVQYDFDLAQVNTTPIGTLNEREDPFIPCKARGILESRILGTGDRFNDSLDDARLLAELGAGLRDMEGGAIAHVCEKAGVDFVSFKCVSDLQGCGSTPQQYMENLKRCLAILTDFVKRI